MQTFVLNGCLLTEIPKRNCFSFSKMLVLHEPCEADPEAEAKVLYLFPLHGLLSHDYQHHLSVSLSCPNFFLCGYSKKL